MKKIRRFATFMSVLLIISACNEETEVNHDSGPETELPETVKASATTWPIVNGTDWVCSGLDGYNGFDNEWQSKLTVLSNKRFELSFYEKPETETDSVWHLAASTLSGRLEWDGRSLISLDPEHWENEFLSNSSVPLVSIPEMLEKRSIIELKRFDDSNFSGVLSWQDSPEEDVSKVECRGMTQFESIGNSLIESIGQSWLKRLYTEGCINDRGEYDFQKCGQLHTTINADPELVKEYLNRPTNIKYIDSPKDTIQKVRKSH